MRELQDFWPADLELDMLYPIRFYDVVGEEGESSGLSDDGKKRRKTDPHSKFNSTEADKVVCYSLLHVM